MSKDERLKIKKDKKKEMRTKEISKMISEGGLGAEKYYEIEKTDIKPEKETKRLKNEEKRD